MIDPRILENEKRLHIALKARLIEDDPNIDEAMAEGLKNLIDAMAKRGIRLQARAQKRREIARDAMLDAGLANLTMPDFTASVRKAPPHVVIIDEALIPPDYIEQRPHILKRDIGEALKNGTPVDGAVLSNPGMTLNVRTR